MSIYYQLGVKAKDFDNDMVDCHKCDGAGVSGHDCGEDICFCVNPKENIKCFNCNGTGEVEHQEDYDRQAKEIRGFE